ncbi:hypothetical protein DYB34_014186, partial [Aphanomyces astaci]
ATRWKEEFYDKFTCAMTNLHVMLLPPSVPYSPELLMHSTTPFSLVDPFHINFTMRKSVLPLDATLYQLYVHVDLPALTLHVSMGQYRHLTNVLARFKHQDPTRAASTAPSSALLTPRFPPSSPSPWDARNPTGDVETQSVMSDDTWFSVEYGDNDGQDTAMDDGRRMSLPSGGLLSSHSSIIVADPPPSVIPLVVVPPPPVVVPTTDRPHLPTTAAPVRGLKKVLDRRVCVCTVTIPIVQVHFQKADEDAAAGRVTCVLEGIKLRFAKRTLSTALRLRLGSLAVDDHADNFVPMHHVLFSLTTQPVLPYTSLLPKTARRRGGRRQKVAHRLPPTSSVESADDLLDINLTSEMHDPTELDVTFGHLHVQFDQSRIAALAAFVLPLVHPTAIEDPKDGAFIPPLSLNDDMSSPHDGGGPPMSLTESVRLDLEKARHALLHQAKQDEQTAVSENVYNVKVHMRSLSICFSNHMDDPLMSMALLDARMDVTLAQGS